MNFLESLQSHLGDSNILSGLSGLVGGDSGSTQTAINGILPSLLGGMVKNASTTDGAQSLWNALDRDHDGSALNDIAGMVGLGGSSTPATDGSTPAINPDGSKIVNHLLGDNQQNVASQVSQSSGLSMGSVMSLMSSLAPMVMSFVGQHKNANNLDANGLASALTDQTPHVQAAAQQHGLLSFLDFNNDGNVMDDVMSVGSSLLSSFMKK